MWRVYTPLTSLVQFFSRLIMALGEAEWAAGSDERSPGHGCGVIATPCGWKRRAT